MTFDIVVITAHPDDLEILAGGTLLLASAAGKRIRGVVVTDGAAGHPDMSPQQLAAVRRAEAQAAAARLGVELTLLGFPDGRLRESDELRDRLRAIVGEAAPGLVLTHHPQDYHPDHRVVAAEALAAAVMAHHGGKGTPPPPPRVAFLDTLAGLGFQPSYYVDISSVLEQKLSALACHASQLEAFRLRGGDLSAQVRLQSAFRGMQAGTAAAEGFQEWQAWGHVKPGGLPLP